MILIGSAAIKHWYSDFNREPKDIDVIRQFNEYPPECILGKRVEVLSNKVLENYPNSVLEPNYLCTLKASHLMWDVSWSKHLWDLNFLLNKGCTIDPELFYKLYSYWEEVHGKNKRSDLKMSKEDFFTNAINYGTQEHDEIHKIINEVPIYTKILKGEVQLDEQKWKLLSTEDKLNLVREEVMVMSYERYKSVHYSIGYSKMLKKFIISHAPKWMLIFVLENYLKLYKPEYNFYEKINGRINTIESVK